MVVYNKPFGLFLIIHSSSARSLSFPGSCHSFLLSFTNHPSMELAGCLATFAGNMKQSSGLCLPFSLQWGHSVISHLAFCLPPPPALVSSLVLPFVVVDVVAAASTFFILFFTSFMSWVQKSFNVPAVANADLRSAIRRVTGSLSAEI